MNLIIKADRNGISFSLNYFTLNKFEERAINF